MFCAAQGAGALMVLSAKLDTDRRTGLGAGASAIEEDVAVTGDGKTVYVALTSAKEVLRVRFRATLSGPATRYRCSRRNAMMSRRISGGSACPTS